MKKVGSYYLSSYIQVSIIKTIKVMKDLQEKVAELRRVMELYDLFQQDDEVGLALQEVETAVLIYKITQKY